MLRRWQILRKLQHHTPRLRFVRRYVTESSVEIIKIPCQSKGSITLDVHHSSESASARNSSSWVLLYLPPGPLHNGSGHDNSGPSTLHSKLNFPVVKVNYRIGPEDRYPTPIHDVLAGYDWAVEHLLPKRGIIRAGRSESVGKIAVYGEFVGGGLATALAVTECRVGQPGVVAAAVRNPVVDWVSLDEYSLNPLDGGNAGHAEVKALQHLRGQLFAKPEQYFDLFASPILFFRSSGKEVPPPETPLEDMEELSQLEREAIYRQEVAMDDDLVEPSEDVLVPIIRRRASRRFPSKTLGLRLPQFYISAGLNSPLAGQARELAQVLRQSFVRQMKNAIPSSSDFGRKVLLEEEEDEMSEHERAALDMQKREAEKSVELSLQDGLGDWDDSTCGQRRVLEVVEWLKSKQDIWT